MFYIINEKDMRCALCIIYYTLYTFTKRYVEHYITLYQYILHIIWYMLYIKHYKVNVILYMMYTIYIYIYEGACASGMCLFVPSALIKAQCIPGADR